MQPSPTGSSAPRWRTHCGSFVVNGDLGSCNDYMLQMFLMCSEGPHESDIKPTRIAMGDQTYEYFMGGWSRRTHLFTEHLASCCDRIGSAGIITREEAALYRTLTERLITLLANEKDYHGAVVVPDQNVASDTMLFYVGEEPVGECSGWIP